MIRVTGDLHTRRAMTSVPKGLDLDPLALEREEMRRMGHAVVELLVRRIAELRDEPVLRTADREELRTEHRADDGQHAPELLAIAPRYSHRRRRFERLDASGQGGIRGLHLLKPLVTPDRR